MFPNIFRGELRTVYKHVKRLLLITPTGIQCNRKKKKREYMKMHGKPRSDDVDFGALIGALINEKSMKINVFFVCFRDFSPVPRTIFDEES